MNIIDEKSYLIATEGPLCSECLITKFYSLLNLTVYCEENIPFYKAPKHTQREDKSK